MVLLQDLDHEVWYDMDIIKAEERVDSVWKDIKMATELTALEGKHGFDVI